MADDPTDSCRPHKGDVNCPKTHASLTSVSTHPRWSTKYPYIEGNDPVAYHRAGAFSFGIAKNDFNIIDVDGTGAIDIGWTNDKYGVPENNGPAQPVLLLSRALQQDLTVQIRHAAVTALEGTGTGEDWHIREDSRANDTDPLLAEITIPAGTDRYTFNIRMVDGTVPEDDETFTATIESVDPSDNVAASPDRTFPQTATITISDNDKHPITLSCPEEYVIASEASPRTDPNTGEPLPPNSYYARTSQACTASWPVPIPAGQSLEIELKYEMGADNTGDGGVDTRVSDTHTFTAHAGETNYRIARNIQLSTLGREIDPSLIGDDIQVRIAEIRAKDTSTDPAALLHTLTAGAVTSVAKEYRYDWTNPVERITVLTEHPDPPPPPPPPRPPPALPSSLVVEDVEVGEGQVAELRAIIEPWPEGVHPFDGVRLVYSTRTAETDREGNPPPGKAGHRDFYGHYDTPIDCIAVERGDKGCIIRIHTIDDSHDEGREEFYVDIAPDPSVPEPLRSQLGEVTATVTIVNDDAMPAAWLVRFGRTVAEQALDGVSDRMAAPRQAGVHGTLAGQPLTFGPAPESPTSGPAPESPTSGPAPDGPSSRAVTAQELLLGSSFTLTGGGMPGAAVRPSGAGPHRPASTARKGRSPSTAR